MLTGIDDSEVVRAEHRLREDRIAVGVALLELKRRSRRSLTIPATIPLLLVAGGIAGAGSRRATGEARRDGSKAGGIARSLWLPLLQSLGAVAVRRILRGQEVETVAAGRRRRDLS